MNKKSSNKNSQDRKKESLNESTMEMEKMDAANPKIEEDQISEQKTSHSEEEENKKMTEAFFEKMEQLLREQQEKYEAKLKACEEKMKEMYVDKLASLEQQKKQYLQEIDTAKKYALQKFVEDLLTVADTLKLAAFAKEENYSQFMDGLNMTINIFINTLKKHQVEEIKVNIGDIFDESIHDCLATQGEGNQIIQIIKPGYKYGERVIRAAQVIVGTKS